MSVETLLQRNKYKRIVIFFPLLSLNGQLIKKKAMKQTVNVYRKPFIWLPAICSNLFIA